MVEPQPNNALDWADDIPSSSSDEEEDKEKGQPHKTSDAKDSNDYKRKPMAEESQEHSYDKHRSYQQDYEPQRRGRGGFRGGRRRGGRGFRGGNRDNFQQRLKLHPSYYIPTILKAKPPFELKLVVAKAITKEDILKHFSIKEDDKTKIEEIKGKRDMPEQSRYLLTIQEPEVAVSVVKGAFKSRVISERPYRLFYDPPSEFITEETSKRKPMTESNRDKKEEEVKIIRNVQKKADMAEEGKSQPTTSTYKKEYKAEDDRQYDSGKQWGKSYNDKKSYDSKKEMPIDKETEAKYAKIEKPTFFKKANKEAAVNR